MKKPLRSNTLIAKHAQQMSNLYTSPPLHLTEKLGAETRRNLWMPATEDITILDNTREAAKNYGFYYGADYVALRPEHLEALKAGKMLAWNDMEYSTFIILVAEGD